VNFKGKKSRRVDCGSIKQEYKQAVQQLGLHKTGKKDILLRHVLPYARALTRNRTQGYAQSGKHNLRYLVGC